VRAVIAAALLTAGVAASVPAQADPCLRPDLAETLPPDAAENVPTNATLFARYAISADYLGEEILFHHGDAVDAIAGVDTRCEAGSVTPWEATPGQACWSKNEGLLSFVPPAPLVPGETYTVEWPKLRGIATATVGRGASVTFVAGSVEDIEAPQFEGLVSIDWDIDRDHDDCTDSLEERYSFALEPGTASDDGGRESLLLLVYQTRGPKLGDDDGPIQLLTRGLPEDGESVWLKRTFDTGLGNVCFAANTRDLTGKQSGGAEHEVCVETVEAPFFAGCALAPRRTRGSSAVAILALLALLARRHGRIA
jgi:hypothetical protein